VAHNLRVMGSIPVSVKNRIAQKVEQQTMNGRFESCTIHHDS